MGVRPRHPAQVAERIRTEAGFKDIERDRGSPSLRGGPCRFLPCVSESQRPLSTLDGRQGISSIRPQREIEPPCLGVRFPGVPRHHRLDDDRLVHRTGFYPPAQKGDRFPLEGFRQSRRHLKPTFLGNRYPVAGSDRAGEQPGGDLGEPRGDHLHDPAERRELRAGERPGRRGQPERRGGEPGDQRDG